MLERRFYPPDEVRDSDAGLGVRRLNRPWTRTSSSGGVTAAGALDDEDIAATKIARGKRNSSSVAFCSDRILTVDVCWRNGCPNRLTKVRGVLFEQLALCRPHSGCKKNHARIHRHDDNAH